MFTMSFSYRLKLCIINDLFLFTMNTFWRFDHMKVDVNEQKLSFEAEVQQLLKIGYRKLVFQ